VTATAIEHRGTAPPRVWAARAAVLAAGVVAAVVTEGRVLAVLAIGAVLAGVLIAARPGTAAVLAVALTFSNATVIAAREHGAPGAIALVVPTLFALTLADQVLRQRLPLVLPRSALWMVTFMLAQTLGALSSRSPVVSVASVQTFLLEGALLFLLVVTAVRGWRLVHLAAIALVVAASALGVLSLVQELVGDDVREFGGFASMSNAVIGDDDGGGGAARHAGPIGEQNRWAQSLVIVLPLAVALGVADRSRAVRLVGRVGAVGISIGTVLTYSRGAVVGLVLTAVIAVVLRWVRASTAVIAAVAATVALASLAPTFADRASTVVTARSAVRAGPSATEGQDGSFANRTTEARAAISVFVAHPVIGVGVGLFPSYFQDEARAQGADRIVGVDREAHSLYLGLAAETGLLGLASFTAFIGSLLASLARVRRRLRTTHPDASALATGFALSIIAYLATGLFLHFAYIRYFWLLAGLAAAMGLVTDLPLPSTTTRPTVRHPREHPCPPNAPAEAVRPA
jgi:O-antigen ligase